jgi:MraZ protein
MFSGEDEHTMDSKGRVFIPVKHREELGDVVFIGRGMDGQINVYPKRVWESMARRLDEEDQADDTIRNTRRFLFAANECELDRQGRILIPPTMRSYAGLGTDVVIIGNKDRLEIWSRERWEENCRQVLANASRKNDDTEAIRKVGLSL